MAQRPARFRSRRPAKTHAALPIKSERPLGLAGGIARVFINSPLSPLLLIVTLLVGLLGLLFTPRQEDPEISVPMVDIFISYPGVSAQQVAALAIRPLERMMSEIVGVKHVYSASRHGEGMVTVRFKVGEALGPSIVKVHDKLQSNLDRMPPGVGLPLVKPKGIDDVPVVTLTLWSEQRDDSQLRELAVELLQQLEAVPNTGAGFVVGGRPREIRIEVAPERLAGYGISLATIAATVRGANGAQAGGYLEQQDGSFKVTSGTFLPDAESVGALILGTDQGMPVYLRDLAQVFEGAGEVRHFVTYHSKAVKQSGNRGADAAPAVTIALAKKEGSNGVAVAKEILDRLETLRGRLLPDDVEVAITRNYGKTANDKVNELLAALLGAAFAVSLLCWLTIGARPALVVIIVIPVVILITIWSAWVLGYTINRVSLFALIFAIGILVDDATVVVENIFRRWLHDGETSAGIAVDAVREVGNPTIIATLTVLAALLPMGFVSGMMGPYMFPIPLLASVAMSFSLVAAFIFTPWFAMLLRPRLDALRNAELREHRIQAGIGRYYRPLIEPLIRSRRLGRLFLWLIVIAFFFVCSLFYTQSVTVKMLPFDNKPEFGVLINMPEGTALPVTANLSQRLVHELIKLPEVTALHTYVGTASPFNFNGLVRHYYLRQEPWEADIQVILTDKNERGASSHQLAEQARRRLTPIARAAGARISVVEMPPGPPVLQTVVAEVYGPDTANRHRVANDLLRMMERVPNLVDVDSYMTAAHSRWHFEIDSEKSIRRGVTVESINRNIEMAMGGYRLGDIKRGSGLEPRYLILQLPLERRSDLIRLSNMPIPAAGGALIPLHELGVFRQIAEEPVIYHKDLRPVEYVTGEMEGRLGAPIYGMLAVEDQLEAYRAPDGVAISGTLTGPPEDLGVSAFEWSGEWVVTYETFRDMGLAFAAALLLIYILLVWEFRNFIQPAIIMAPIPLTLIGIIPGHWLLDAEFTATSMIGFIALAGIEVRNSILLVDFAKNEVHRGVAVREAVMMAGQIRMRPIWVTDLTMMAGAFAILFDPIFQGMAISLLFGPIVATTLTLIVVPLGCISAGGAFCAAGEPAVTLSEPEETFSSTAAGERG